MNCGPLSLTRPLREPKLVPFLLQELNDVLCCKCLPPPDEWVASGVVDENEVVVPIRTWSHQIHPVLSPGCDGSWDGGVKVMGILVEHLTNIKQKYVFVPKYELLIYLTIYQIQFSIN